MGSLFKLRDYWTFKVDEEFSGCGAVALANVDNEKNGPMKIILGSFQGILRILDAKQKGFRPEDVLLEKKFPEPILQVACGNFLPNSANRNTLAILFPRRLVLASIVRGGAAAKAVESTDAMEQPTNFFLQFNVVAEHRFDHTTFNFTHGCFGNAPGNEQEYLCVQSMDGQVSFVDHNKIMFQRFLPSSHFLVPGVLAYVPKMDAFLTSSSSFELHCYRYKTFTQSVGSEVKDADEGNGGRGQPKQEGRKITVDWAFNLGEDVLDIRSCRMSKGMQNSQVDIVVLCERTLFVIKENGELRFHKRLDSAAACCVPYAMPDGKSHNVLVGTHTDHVVVHSDAAILWSAKAPATPIALAVAMFCGVQGMIVTLTDDGTLSINYLGTDPASNPVQVLESKELDYDAMDEEHRRLQTMIRQAIGAQKVEPQDTVKLVLDAPVPNFTVQQRSCRVVANVTHTGMQAAQKVTIVVNTTEPVAVEQSTIVFEDGIAPQQTLRIPLNFFPLVDSDCLVPTSLNVDVIVTYVARNGETLTTRASCALPFGLVASPVAPLKNVAFKVQIDTNKAPPPSLQDLFRDMAALGEISPNVMSLQYCNGSDATVLVSKNAGRFRIQSSTFEGLWLLVSDLVRRLKRHYQSESTEPLRIDISEGLPLEEFMGMIDVHCTMRAELADAQQRLASVAHQFRAIQKRLLVRYRDRSPTPLTSLQLLFEETYRRLHQSSDEVDLATSRLRQAGAMLSSSTHLMLLLLRYRCQDTLPKGDMDLLQHYLSPLMPFNSASGALGWEEITDANMTHLLRTALSRNAKESSSAPQPLVASTDGTKVKKHLTIVFDRLCKGASITNSQLSNVEVMEGGRNVPQVV